MNKLQSQRLKIEQRIQSKKFIAQSSRQLVKEIEKFKILLGRVEIQLKVQCDSLMSRLRRQAELTLKKFAIRLQKQTDVNFNYQHMPYEYDFKEAEEQLIYAFRRIEENMEKSMLTYLDELLKFNVFKNDSVAVMHTSNNIVSHDPNWNSMTSKAPLTRAQIFVEGFTLIETTYFALGVSTEHKSYGPCKSLVKEKFLGCIYLNGRDADAFKPTQPKSNFKTTTLTKPAIKFILQDSDRRLLLKRDDSIRQQLLILQDNTEYYLYMAWKGPISIKVK